MSQENEYGLEMETLVESGAPRQASNGGTTPPNPKQSRSAQFGIFAVLVIVAALVLGAGKEDNNSTVTDVDALPVAENVEAVVTADDMEEDLIEAPEAPEIDSKNTAGEIRHEEYHAGVPKLIRTELEEEGYKHPDSYVSTAYVRRARHDRTNLPEMAEKWGSWTLVDSKTRPNLSALYKKYPNRDVPMSEFPDDAWQVDTEYLQEFLPEAIALCERALEAILAEYGHFERGVTHLEDALVDGTKGDPAFMFNLTMMDPERAFQQGKSVPKTYFHGKQAPLNGGFTSYPTLARLRKALLHSIVTEDKFFFTMGGHSSAAGHGNHFQQSYTMQVQRALEPVLARLGVYHISRNMGMGGLGTLHNALGMQDIYGGDNSILMWDSGMTEGKLDAKDLFARQGLLGGDRVPVLFGLPDEGKYEALCGSGMWSTGFWASGFGGIPETATPEDIDEHPYATLFIDCAKPMNKICRKDGYNGVCWIDRDEFEQQPKQLKVMGGRAKWHPGNLYHQLQSREISFNLIKILREALIDWKDLYNYTLPDKEFHVTDEYERIRTTVRQNTTVAYCFEFKNVTDAICDVPFHGRSEMTPRANPLETSIRSILRSDVELNKPEPNIYDPPDVYNPALDPPEGQIDYLAIVENGVEYPPMRSRYDYLHRQLNPPPSKQAEKSGLSAGKGWHLDVIAAADNCDGTYDSFCNRGEGKDCLLYAHNDNRGSILADALSGWILMTASDVSNGHIMVLFTGAGSYRNPQTLGWKCENNAESCDKPLPDEESNHEPEKSSECDTYMIQYSIDGQVTTWDANQFKAQLRPLERLIDVSVLLEDPSLFHDGPRDVEVGLRVTGDCGRAQTFQLSHVYWS